MSLLDTIMQAPSTETPCKHCKYLINPRGDLIFCLKVDKIIMPDFPPTRCELREVED